MTHRAPLDPASFKVDPYEYHPVPLADEMRKLGVFPIQRDRPVSLENPSEAVHVQTRIPPEVVYTIDRLIERRLWGFKSRQELFRTALTLFVCELADEVQQDQVSLSVWRLNQQRRQWAELERCNNVEEMIALTRKVAGKYLALGAHLDAIRALRSAKRFMEDVPSSVLRERVRVGVYGGEGMVMPPAWEEDEVAKLWAQVIEGTLDRDDEESAREQTRLT